MITCYARRHYEGRTRSLFSPLLSENARQFIWRNSLLEQGEHEWMCVICGFDNKPRNKLCTLCGIDNTITMHFMLILLLLGTSHDFSKQYKSEKMNRKEINLLVKSLQSVTMSHLHYLMIVIK